MPKYLTEASIMIYKCRYILPEHSTLLYGNIIDYAYTLVVCKHKDYYTSIACVRMLCVYILQYLRQKGVVSFIKLHLISSVIYK
jgi:hypothetical protein